MSANNCKVCSNIDGFKSSEPWNSPLFESDNFFAIPSLGSLVEGWVLIFSKEHYLSLSKLNNNLIDEFKNFKNKVKNLLENKYGKITMFEHGPSKKNTLVGCGVDHFHMHLVPLKDINLLDLAKKYDSSVKWNTMSKIEDLKSNKNDFGYLFLELSNGSKYFASEKSIGSQFFRRVIAKELNIENKFDWKLHPMTENIYKTIENLEIHSNIAI